MERFGPTRRGGPVFRWLGEDISIDLANTVMVVREGAEAVDLLADDGQMQRWLESERERLGGGDLELGAEGFTRLCELRDAVRALFAASAAGEPLPAAALACLNAASGQDPCSPQLWVGDDGVAEVRESSGTGVDRLLGMSARAAIRLLGEPGGAELHLCNAPSCGMFFLGKRRWCCAACGNRARAARHYRRQRAAPGVDPDARTRSRGAVN